jgi:outer membrane protein OmpA-like peptidoglycan-associated protein
VPVSASCPPQVVENNAADLDPIQFTVYFDYDKANLTPQASTLVREASSRALENDIETVVVAGNTDTSGGSAYNQALSERRARAVRDGLIANGVSADRIRLEAFGETNLAKPTADGVREPLNRRADVVISFE